MQKSGNMALNLSMSMITHKLFKDSENKNSKIWIRDKADISPTYTIKEKP